MDWRASVKKCIPTALLNRALLTFPLLYRTRLVYYETTLRDGHGIDDLLCQLDLALGLAGDIIECGSSRCGASAIMASFLQAKHAAKTVYACDSFEGFDRTELARERQSGRTRAPERAFTSTSYSYVRQKLRTLGLDGIVEPVKGYFRDTLPGLDRCFCLALIDCDLRDSMLYCAQTLWPRIVPSGCMLFDDYASEDFQGARLAVDAFVAARASEILEHGLLRRLYYVRKKPAPLSTE